MARTCLSVLSDDSRTKCKSELRCQWEMNRTVLLIPEILKLAFHFYLNLSLKALANKQHSEEPCANVRQPPEGLPLPGDKRMRNLSARFAQKTRTQELRSHSIPCAAELWSAGFLMNSACWLVLAWVLGFILLSRVWCSFSCWY